MSSQGRRRNAKGKVPGQRQDESSLSEMAPVRRGRREGRWTGEEALCPPRRDRVTVVALPLVRSARAAPVLALSSLLQAEVTRRVVAFSLPRGRRPVQWMGLPAWRWLGSCAVGQWLGDPFCLGCQGWSLKTNLRVMVLW